MANETALVRKHTQRMIVEDDMVTPTRAFPVEAVEPADILARSLVLALPNDGREHLIAVALDVHGKPIAWEVVATGTVDSVILEPRDVYRWAVNVPRARFVGVAHNHPSGVTTPSKPDIRGTAGLAAAGRIIGLDLAWSLVVTHENETWEAITFKGKGGAGKGGDDAEPKRREPSPEDEQELEPEDEPEPEPEDELEPGDEDVPLAQRHDGAVDGVELDVLKAAVGRVLGGGK